MIYHIFQWPDMINSGHISTYITSFDQFRRFRDGSITLRARSEASCQVNCPEMIHNDTVCLVVARYVHLWLHLTRLQWAQVILFKLEELILICYVCLSTPKWGRHCIIMASNGPVWPHIVSDDHVWFKIWFVNGLDHIEEEVGNLDLRYHDMACMALWGEIQQIWPTVA